MIPFRRIIYCLDYTIIFVCGVISFISNIMICNYKTKNDIKKANIGRIISCMFIFTGVSGFYFSIVYPEYLIYTNTLFFISFGSKIFELCHFFY